ncbi:unnamed protein product [Aphanomyces euteiches]|uniref:BED-type domain-containing protein n=1 Tax=Aphanomyces euteiches TaxID=100861 RepID=A0A6G0XJ98_9STRA|nr:hypothetical protein Ae201684_004167 [Aphanomyces euteiches]KAH9084333.1 hypothetical protein LEN26_020897 [Aphanomyces euteiches]KAH9093982.1 hypothetical protein Ae201684P_016601 [Aphanomyces euteiches]KAH9108943.1 hypothetical protein AeMF1_015902 [Aphanomyces euteiches]KAH9190573.1 hypothetical protein AeNC1_007443 [Aphanomyces euteiches]
MGRTELPIWQDFSEKYRAVHRRTPLVRCKTCGEEICASTTSLYQHKNVCGKKTRPLEPLEDGTTPTPTTPNGELLPRETQSTRKRKEIWDDFGEKYKVEGRKTLVVNCKMCGKDVAAATTSLYQHQAVCANIEVPKQQKRPKIEAPVKVDTFQPVEDMTKKFLTVQETIQQLRTQIETAHVDDAPALQTALELYQTMRANILEKLNAMAHGQFIV